MTLTQKEVVMPRKKIYGEKKTKLTLTLTQTAKDWLESKQTELKANSLSDTIERMARENITVG
jgi:hypothetical protein